MPNKCVYEFVSRQWIPVQSQQHQDKGHHSPREVGCPVGHGACMHEAARVPGLLLTGLHHGG